MRKPRASSFTLGMLEPARSRLERDRLDKAGLFRGTVRLEIVEREPRAQNLVAEAMEQGVPPMLLAHILLDEGREPPEHALLRRIAARGASPPVRRLVDWTPEEWAAARAFLDAGRR